MIKYYFTIFYSMLHNINIVIYYIFTWTFIYKEFICVYFKIFNRVILIIFIILFIYFRNTIITRNFIKIKL